jgi:signal transduction histidine kinase
MKPADLSRPASAQTILIDLVSTLTAVVDLATLPSAVLLTLKHGLAPVDAGWLALKDPASGHFRAVVAVGCDLPRLRAVAWQPGAALLGCDDAGASCLFTAPSAIQAALAGLPPDARAALEQALPPEVVPARLVIVPLSCGGRVLGVVWLLTAQDSHSLSTADAPLLRQLGALIGLALDRAQRAAQAADVAPHLPADQARSEALATLSHELRTPLAAIKGYATALLLDEVVWAPEEQREFLTLIDRECDAVQAMISEVLDSALIDAGHLGLQPEPVRLPHLVREVADEIQRQTVLHRLVVDFPADFPLLMADPRRLRQVLRNILDNAVKYSPDGGLIVMRGEVRPADVVISVADQGVGIAPEDLIPLFDKYFRVQPATGERVPGTGLGLPITRGIIEAHGGRIWAESKLGQGTTLYFSLPRGSQALGEAA